MNKPIDKDLQERMHKLAEDMKLMDSKEVGKMHNEFMVKFKADVMPKQDDATIGIPVEEFNDLMRLQETTAKPRPRMDESEDDTFCKKADLIDKACKWLGDNLLTDVSDGQRFVTSLPYDDTKGEFIYRFRKAMEE